MAEAQTTLRVDFVSESAGYRNTFGWYNRVTGVGGTLFADASSPGANGSSVDFTVNTADVGNIEYFLIPNGAGISANSDSELSRPIKVIQLADGSWAVATLDSNGNVQTSGGKPNILVGEGRNAFFTEKAKNEGGVDHASSTVGSNQTAATLAGDQADGATLGPRRATPTTTTRYSAFRSRTTSRTPRTTTRRSARMPAPPRSTCWRTIPIRTAIPSR
jgi:hypothetical protein